MPYKILACIIILILLFSVSTSPSVSSNLCGRSELSLGPHSLMAQLAGISHSSMRGSEELLDRQRSQFNDEFNLDNNKTLLRSRSRSRSVNTSFAWSSMDGSALALSSPDTLSLSLSEMEGQPSQVRLGVYIEDNVTMGDPR